jgi:glucose uptake protein GlcU
MDSESMAMLVLIGTSGYLIFKFWKTMLKLVIGIICFCIVYTYISLKKYFDNNDKQGVEQVVQETVKQSTPVYINE